MPPGTPHHVSGATAQHRQSPRGVRRGYSDLPRCHGGWPPRQGGIKKAASLVGGDIIELLSASGTPPVCQPRPPRYPDADAFYPVLRPLPPISKGSSALSHRTRLPSEREASKWGVHGEVVRTRSIQARAGDTAPRDLAWLRISRSPSTPRWLSKGAATSADAVPPRADLRSIPPGDMTSDRCLMVQRCPIGPRRHTLGQT